MLPYNRKEKKSYKQKNWYICKKEFSYDDKKCYKVWDHCHYTRKYRVTAHSMCNLRYKTPKEILLVFHSGSDFDYHFIIKYLVEEFDGHVKG